MTLLGLNLRFENCILRRGLGLETRDGFSSSSESVSTTRSLRSKYCCLLLELERTGGWLKFGGPKASEVNPESPREFDAENWGSGTKRCKRGRLGIGWMTRPPAGEGWVEDDAVEVSRAACSLLRLWVRELDVCLCSWIPLCCVLQLKVSDGSKAGSGAITVNVLLFS